MDVGSTLRQAREKRGLSIAALAATTRIPPRAIEGIERNDLTAIPPPPYARGFVAAYAREVGLDPQGTVRAFFAQFQSLHQAHADAEDADGTRDEPAQRPWMPAVAVLTLVALLGIFFVRPTPIDRSEPDAVGTSGDAPAGSELGPAPALPARDMAPARRGDEEITAVIEVDHPVWVAAAADGERVLYRIVPAGTRETLRARRELTLRVGDAGAVRLGVGGGPLEPIGRRGEVRDVVLRNE